MLKIRQLIKKVRACRTAEEERSVINKEAAEIRNSSKNLNNPHKARDLAKAIYMQMMGYQTSFMQLSCINLLASKNFTEKRMAYSALSLVIDESSKILLLATGTIKKDLQSDDKSEVALALNAIGDIATPDMCRELSQEVVHVIKMHSDPNIKKKAGCAAAHIVKKCPELVDTYKDLVSNLIEDRIHGVCMSGIILMLELINVNPKIEKHFRKFQKTFIDMEKALLNTNYSPDFDVNGITDPFLQARLVEALKYTAKGSKEKTEELADLFVSVQSLTDEGRLTGYAIQYEIVRSIGYLDATQGLKSLSSNIISKFLSGKDLNLKYIALNTLKDVIRYDLAEVQKHKDLILGFLKESDISLQRRSLDLIYLIVNKNNLKQITKECLSFLPNANDELKLDLTSKLIDCIDQYANNFKWEIDTLIKMVVLANNKIYEDTLSKIINIIIKVSDLKIYSVHKLYITLKNNINNVSLVKIALYVIGECCDSLVNNSVLGPNNENISVSIDQLLETLNDCGLKNIKYDTILEYLLNSLIKISAKFPEKKDNIKEIFLIYKNSYHYEVQQRANEYLKLQGNSDEQLIKTITDSIPTPKEDNIYDKDLINQNEELEIIDPNDTTGYIKLSTEPIKTSNFSNKQSNQPFSIPSNIDNILDNVNLKNNDNNVQSNNNINLFDINNIFGTSAPQSNEQPAQNTNTLLDMLNATEKKENNNFLDMLNATSKTEIPQTKINEEGNMKECFKNEDISLYHQIKKTSDSSYEGKVYASNNSTEELNNIKINFMVLKFVTLKVLSTSGNTLNPNESLGISKEFTMTSNEPKKKVVMKIRLSYMKKGSEKTSTITIDNI